MSGNPSEASQSLTEAFRSGDSAEERQQSLDDDPDYNTGGGGGGDDGDDSGLIGPTPDEVSSIDEQTSSDDSGVIGPTPDEVSSIEEQTSSDDSGVIGPTPDEVSSIDEQTSGGDGGSSDPAPGFQEPPETVESTDQGDFTETDVSPSATDGTATGGSTETEVAFDSGDVTESQQQAFDGSQGSTGGDSGPTRNADGTVTENVFGQEVTFGDFAQGAVGLNDPDEDIQASLTRGDQAGFASEEEERRIRQDIRQRQEFFGVGEEASRIVGRFTDSETAQTAGRALGDLPGTLAAAPAGATLLLDTGAEAAENAPRTVGEFGAVDTAGAVANTVTSSTRGQVQQFREQPVYTGTQLTAEVLLGTAATRAGSRAGQAVTNTRVRAQADGTVDFEDITSERGAQGESPTFDTSPGGSDADAVAEIERRAGDQPAEVQEAVGTDQVLFRSEAERLPGDLEATEGSFELPGLFASPDASPLRTDLSSGRPSVRDLTPRLPRASDFTGDTQRLSAFEGDRVDAMDSGATGTGFAVRDADGEIVDTFPDTGSGAQAARRRAEEIDGERVPDPSTSGAQFLQEADEGTAFVRPSGSRTTELEAIFPEGSEFERRGTLAVNLPNNEVATLDVFRRPRDGPDADTSPRDADAPDSDRGPLDTDADADGPVFDADEITELERRGTRSTPDGQPVSPPLSFGGGTTRPSGGTSGSASGTPAPTSTGSGPFSSGSTTPSGSAGTTPSGSGGGSGTSGGPGSGTGTPGSPGGSGGGGSSTSTPPSTGTPGTPGSPGNPGTPIVPPDTPPRPPRDFDFEGRGDDDEEEFSLFGGAREVRTDFRNPLTGERLTTEGDE